MAKRMRFITWARKDPEDNRKINYALTDEQGNVDVFTSEDFMPFSMLERLRNAWVKSVVLIGDEWYADLYEGKATEDCGGIKPVKLEEA